MVAATLLGRHDELAALRLALLSPECRLLTLTGPPGVGKSRLAAALADEVGDRFPDGVARVDLLGSTSAEAVAAFVGTRLGIGRGATGSAVSRLAGHLQDRTALLVLDSCEAVADLGPLITVVLAGSRRVKVLATSQERIRVPIEREYAVPPLAMPRIGASTDELDQLAAVPAMAMLLASTRVVRPEFALDPGNARALVTICRQLEGLPLALEVAAARLGQFDPAELTVRLENRHRLLDAQLAPSGRHRSLRAAIAWSHDLLREDERRVFRRLAVFPGAWSLAAAAAVIDDPDIDVVEAVASLVAKNLVRRVTSSDGTEAFDMLDSLRRYGQEKLERAGKESARAERHFRSYYAALAEASEAGMGTVDEALSVHWSDDDLTNLRAALSASVLAGDLTNALPLASAAGWYWYTRGGLSETAVVLDLVDQALTADLPHDAADALAGAVLIAGIIAWARDERAAAASLLQRACAMAAASGNVRRGAIAHAFLGHLARTSGDLAGARREHLTAQAAFVELGSERGRAWASHDLALVALAEDRLEEAAALLGDALTDFEDDRDAWSCAWGWSGLAEVALRREEWLVAGGLLVRALEVYVENGDQPRVAHCCGLLAEVARARGLASVAHDLARPGPPTSRTMLLARSVLESTPVPASPLTPRQRQVAALVAEGATNRQIARQLGIADKTVEVHLAQIMARLEVHNRAQVATHAVQAGLESPAR